MTCLSLIFRALGISPPCFLIQGRVQRSNFIIELNNQFPWYDSQLTAISPELDIGCPLISHRTPGAQIKENLKYLVIVNVDFR